MKHLRYIKLFAVVILISIVLNPFCFAENTSGSEDAYKSYSELLREAVQKAYSHKVGYQIPTSGGFSMMMLMGLELPQYRVVEGLDTTDAVPFLIDVVENGPDWPIEEFRSYHKLAPHIGRCYAVLCLAFTKDARAYPILTDLLQNGFPLIDPNAIGGEIQRHNIRGYAAAGLGILADDRAFDLLVKGLDDANIHVKCESMLALANSNDTRTIEPILNAALKYDEIGQPFLILCMRKMTRFRLEAELNRDKKTVTFPAFPELGVIKRNKKPYKKAWSHWYKVAGRQLTKQQFENKYNNWKDAKTKHPKNSDDVKYAKRKLTQQVGVAALPLLIEKINKGETDLIDIVSGLTDGKIKRDATKQEVLLWWEKNKEKWTVFPEK